MHLLIFIFNYFSIHLPVYLCIFFYFFPNLLFAVNIYLYIFILAIFVFIYFYIYSLFIFSVNLFQFLTVNTVFHSSSRYFLLQKPSDDKNKLWVRSSCRMFIDYFYQIIWNRRHVSAEVERWRSPRCGGSLCNRLNSHFLFQQQQFVGEFNLKIWMKIWMNHKHLREIKLPRCWFINTKSLKQPETFKYFTTGGCTEAAERLPAQFH